METSDPDCTDKSTVTPEDIACIDLLMTAVRMQAERTSDLEDFLWGLIERGLKLSARFVDSKRMFDIEFAVALQRLGLEHTSDGSRQKIMLLSDLGKSYFRRYQHSNEPTDLELAIEVMRQAISGNPDGYFIKIETLVNLGAAYLSRYERHGDQSDCDTALEYFERSLLLPESNEGKPDALSNIAVLYRVRFERQGQLADITAEIHYLGQAISLYPDDHKRKLELLTRLANLYTDEYERSNNLSTLQQGIEYCAQQVQLMPIENPNRPRALQDLASLCYKRIDHLEELTDIDNAISCFKHLVSLFPDSHPDKPFVLNYLARSYQMRVQHVDDLSDIENAIAHQSQAVSLVPDSHEVKGGFLHDLGSSYQCRFKRLGKVADIDKAVDYQRQAVSLTPCGHRRRLLVLASAGSAHYHRFQCLGYISDINKATDYLVEAVSCTADDDASKPDKLNTLGVTYYTRYHALNELPDINNAITCLSQAVVLTPDNSVEKPRTLGNLGVSYMYRFRSQDDRSDIIQALDYLGMSANVCLSQEASLAPYGSMERTRQLGNLGIACIYGSQSQGDRSDLDQAIEYLRKAVLLTSPHHSSKPGRLIALGDAYQLRFEGFGSPQDSNKAIACQIEGLSLYPDGHADKPPALLRLSESCMYHTEESSLSDEEKRRVAVTSFREAAQSQTGDPYTRFRAARAWACMFFLEDADRQLAYQRAMELLPQIVWLGATIDQRYKRITDLGDIATEAASFAISRGTYDKALEWLEEGRSIVWNQILQLRTPLQELLAADPELANCLEVVGRQLEHAGSKSPIMPMTTNNTSNLEQDAEHHRHLAYEWDKLINRARAIPGFQNFMRPRTGKELLRIAKDGPVVVINVHSWRCDALILQPNSHEIAHIPLERFSHDKAVDARVDLVKLLGTGGDRARGFKRSNSCSRPEETFKRALAVLWLDVVKPIFDILGYTHKLPVDELPHVTWCTTGPLSFLPLHAAGCYDGAQPNAFDLAVSSYIPTLGVLLAPMSHSPGPNAGILAVGQEKTKGLGDLPNTVSELIAIKKHADSTRYLQLDGNNATVGSVLKAMGEYSWVHLACHATQNREDPSQSAFHLSDGNLALDTISKQSLRNKGLAFLSACQTAAGDDKLADEAVHLAAGMLMAGYPSVIATMWSINDADAPEVAERVYADLLRDGNVDHRRAARALHGAVAALREKVGEESFWRWVPFIHIGL